MRTDRGRKVLVERRRKRRDRQRERDLFLELAGFSPDGKRL